MSVRITNIQHFCLHDGPGIRTTVFLKGCNLHCPWCANPECISPDIEGEFGQDISIEDLKEEILKDEQYYSLNDGGVTFSGGEPLLQIKQLEELLISLNAKNINVCFETALFISSDLLKVAIPYADEFIVDIKILTEEPCKRILGGNVKTYFNNLNLLFNSNKQVTFRVPVSNEVLNEDNVNLILDLISTFKSKKIEIFKIHNLAKDKYDKLGKEFYFSSVSDDDLETLFDKIKNISADVKILEL